MAEPNPLDPSGVAQSLADAIRQQADNIASGGGGGGGGNRRNNRNNRRSKNPLDQLIEQINQISVEATPYETLLQQATGAAGAQFDPLISELEAQIAGTTRRGNRNQREAKQMYNALAQDIAAEMPQITNEMAAASQETEDRYNQTQNELQNQYNQQAQQQAELFQQLGIQAAAPEASQQSMEDQAYFQQQSKTDEQAAIDLLNQMTQSDVAYNRQSAQNTRLAGVNTAQDIGRQLEEYLQTAGGELSGLRAGREGAIQSMLAQLQQQDAQRITSAEESEYDRLMDMFNLQLDMQKMQQDQLGSQQNQESLFSGTSGPAGASNYLSEIYGSNNTFTSNEIMNAINDVMSQPEVVSGRYETGEEDQYGNPQTSKVTDEYLTDLLRQYMTEGDLDPDTAPGVFNTQYSNADVNHAINALLAYLGKLE